MATEKAKEKQMEFTSKFGNKYILQKVSVPKWLDIMDNVEVNGSPKRTKLYPAVLENIVVQPQMKMEDFDGEGYNGYAEIEEVVTQALRFQQGKQ